MSTPNDMQMQNTLTSMFQGFKMLSTAFFQMNARIGALKAIVCELHPEVAARLEDKLRQDQNAASKEFSDLQRMIELLASTASGQSH
jgi:hypothetical protein